MKILCALAFLFCGCAHSKFYHNGALVADIQGNFATLDVSKDGGIHATGVNHSTPTRAGGSVLGTGLAGAVPLVTAIGL